MTMFYSVHEIKRGSLTLLSHEPLFCTCYYYILSYRYYSTLASSRSLVRHAGRVLNSVFRSHLYSTMKLVVQPARRITWTASHAAHAKNPSMVMLPFAMTPAKRPTIAIEPRSWLTKVFCGSPSIWHMMLCAAQAASCMA